MEMTATKPLYAYSIVPLDFGWQTMPTAEAYRGLLMKDAYSVTQGAESVRAFNEFLQRSLDFASEKTVWEGDFREEPRIVVMPGECETVLAVLWKQENNGDTFVVSQVALPWLAAISTD